MSCPKRSLRDLAAVLRRTAETHRDTAAMLAEFTVLSAVVTNMQTLATVMEETAKQIEDGVYGDPAA